MKTPIQELIDKWEQEKASRLADTLIYQEFINDAKEMLEKEKEVIESAYWDGAYWDGKQDLPLVGSRCEDYYNKAFNNNDE